MTPAPAPTPQAHLLRLVAAGVMALALLVLLGWHIHSTVLVQLHPTLPPMQYNTALGFAVVGFGFWALAAGRALQFRLAGLAVAALGAATLAQYVFGINLHIDQAFFPSEVMVRVSHPGRMSPATALCFILSGLWLLLERSQKRGATQALQSLMGGGMLAIALSTALGYLSGAELQSLLGFYTRMAVHTAMAFAAIGIGLLTWSWGRARRHLAVAYVAIAGLMLSIQTVLVFRQAEYRAIHADFTRYAENYLSRAHREVLRDIEAVESVGRLYAASQAVDREEFRAFVEPMLAQLPWMQAIEWVPHVPAADRAPAAHYPITYIEPIEGNEASLGLDLASEPLRRELITAALDTGQMRISGWLPLLERQSQELGFVVVLPARALGADASQGAILGVFRTHGTLYGAGQLGRPEHLTVYLADESTPTTPQLFEIGPQGRLAPLPASGLARIQQHFYHDELISLPGRRWRLICTPTSAWFQEQRTLHPWLAGAFGLLLTLVFCLYLRTLGHHTEAIEQQVTERTQALIAANTQLERQQQTLRDSEARFRTLTMHAPVGIYLTDLKGQCTFINEHWCQMVGLTPAAALGDGWARALMPEDAPRVLREWHAAAAAGRDLTVEYRCRAADGRTIWCVDHAVALRDADGRLTGYTGTVTDVTMRVLEDQAKKEQQEHLARITNAVPGVVYQYQLKPDGSQRFLFVNQGTVPVFGLPAERVLQDFSLVWNMVVPEDVPGLVASIQQSAQTLKPWHHEFRVLTAEGRLKWIRGRSIPDQPLPDGTIVWNGLLLDVTEEKDTQRWLQQLSSVVEQTADIVVITDRQGIIEYVNPSFERQTGYRRGEVVGQTPRLLKSGRHPAAFYQTLWRTITSGQVFRAEMTNRRKNGELYHEEQTITPIRDGAGQITHFVSTARDVTARRQAETVLQQKLSELERFRLLTTEREYRMIELKEQVNRLCEELGRPRTFDLSFLPKNGHGGVP